MPFCGQQYNNNILNKFLHNSYETEFDFGLEGRGVYVIIIINNKLYNVSNKGHVLPLYDT